MREFLTFLKEYGVVGLAVAVVIGGKLNELVTSIVNDLLMPLVFQPALKAAMETIFVNLALTESFTEG